MNWKSWPYWVKGGILITAVGVALLALFIILKQRNCYDGGFERSCVYKIEWVYHHHQVVTVLNFSIIPLIFIGILTTVIGFYGKFKNRKQLNS